mmetsp:Transcript_52112/g.121951  ORF Transcript_52112/g.121951 Transcript_52112/m.121951 type:complete len:203 (-) Transcript_52112:376-984(-)
MCSTSKGSPWPSTHTTDSGGRHSPARRVVLITGPVLTAAGALKMDGGWPLFIVELTVECADNNEGVPTFVGAGRRPPFPCSFLNSASYRKTRSLMASLFFSSTMENTALWLVSNLALAATATVMLNASKVNSKPAPRFGSSSSRQRPSDPLQTMRKPSGRTAAACLSIKTNVVMYQTTSCNEYSTMVCSSSFFRSSSSNAVM